MTTQSKTPMINMAKKKKPREPFTDDHMAAAKNLAKDLVIRAYFARRQKERDGLRGKIKSLFSRRQKTKAPVIDMLDHVRGEWVQAGVCYESNGKIGCKSLMVNRPEKKIILKNRP